MQRRKMVFPIVLLALSNCSQAAPPAPDDDPAATDPDGLAGAPPVVVPAAFRPPPCGIREMTDQLERTEPGAALATARARQQLDHETAMARSASAAAAQALPFVIPVAVHIIHGNGDENVSDAKVIEAIAQVNADFRAANASASLIHPSFLGLVRDAQMVFKLARKDPSGNPTTGITRHFNPTWTANGAADQVNMKLSTGWPQQKYLNVYVVRSAYGGNSSAFAYYPSQVTPPFEHYDGVIISSWAFGRTTPGYFTILSHEIGHWANLIHTWGEGEVGAAGNCATDDLVTDTPNTIGAFNTACKVNTQSCGTLNNNENFMDYGACQSMFTNGQVNRMQAALNSSVGRRNEIWSPANLIATGVADATGCTTHSGQLGFAGQFQYQPDNNWYQTTAAGTQSAQLTGPASANFDLELQRSTSSGWVTVASSRGAGATERVAFDAAPGYFMWKVSATAGSGPYTLCIAHP